jgi:hypothetical protein
MFQQPETALMSRLTAASASRSIETGPRARNALHALRKRFHVAQIFGRTGIPAPAPTPHHRLSNPWYRRTLQKHAHWSFLQQLQVTHKVLVMHNQAGVHMMAPARMQPPTTEARTLQLATTAPPVKRPQLSQSTLPHTEGLSYVWFDDLTGDMQQSLSIRRPADNPEECHEQTRHAQLQCFREPTSIYCLDS